MRVCSICHHRKLAQIDHALLSGQTQAAVARKYSVSPDAVNRHTRHMQTAIAHAVAAREPNRANDIAYGNALLDELGRIKASVEHVEQEAENARDWRTLLMATRQRADLVKLQAELTGQVEGTRNLNVNVDMQVDEATAQRIVSAYLLTHGRPQDASQEGESCNPVQGQREDQLSEVLSLCRTSLASYAAALYPAFELPPHIRFLIAKLEQVESGAIRRLIVTLPPPHGKSMLCSQYFPAWFLGRNPTQHVITASHTEELSAVFGRRTRNLVSDAHHRAIFPACTLTADSGAASRFELTAGGSFLSVGRGSAVTGHGGTLVIVDDPIADAEQAGSDTVRRSVREWFESALYTRMPADGRMVLVMTRWHEDDLAGWLMRDHASDGWREIRLPAVAEPGDLLNREVGSPLWPEKFPLQVLGAIEQAIGSYAWGALYMQNPMPEAGGIIQRQWCTKFYREPPAGLGIILQSWDLSFKNTSKRFRGWACVGAAWGRVFSLGPSARAARLSRHRGRHPGHAGEVSHRLPCDHRGCCQRSGGDRQFAARASRPDSGQTVGRQGIAAAGGERVF